MLQLFRNGFKQKEHTFYFLFIFFFISSIAAFAI